MAAATIRSFSARDQLRRRCTDVITSTCVLVIGVVLGLLLALAPMTQLCKAVLTGCLLIVRREMKWFCTLRRPRTGEQPAHREVPALRRIHFVFESAQGEYLQASQG